MSLLSEAMENCVVYDKRIVDDGYGGYVPGYFPGAVGIYTVTTTKAMNLQYHDVFKRVSDGKIFRVTSDGDDKKTPRSAGLDMRQVTAEEWELPKNE